MAAPKQKNPVRMVGGPYHGQVFMADWDAMHLIFDTSVSATVEPNVISSTDEVARTTRRVPITLCREGRGLHYYVAYWGDGR